MQRTSLTKEKKRIDMSHHRRLVLTPSDKTEIAHAQEAAIRTQLAIYCLPLPEDVIQSILHMLFIPTAHFIQFISQKRIRTRIMKQAIAFLPIKSRQHHSFSHQLYVNRDQLE